MLPILVCHTNILQSEDHRFITANWYAASQLVEINSSQKDLFPKESMAGFFQQPGNQNLTILNQESAKKAMFNKSRTICHFIAVQPACRTSHLHCYRHL